MLNEKSRYKILFRGLEYCLLCAKVSCTDLINAISGVNMFEFFAGRVRQLSLLKHWTP